MQAAPLSRVPTKVCKWREELVQSQPVHRHIHEDLRSKRGITTADPACARAPAHLSRIPPSVRSLKRTEVHRQSSAVHPAQNDVVHKQHWTIPEGYRAPCASMPHSRSSWNRRALSLSAPQLLRLLANVDRVQLRERGVERRESRLRTNPATAAALAAATHTYTATRAARRRGRQPRLQLAQHSANAALTPQEPATQSRAGKLRRNLYASE